MDALDHELLLALQDGIPLVKEPFTTIASGLEITPDEVIERLKTLRAERIIRKFGLFVWKRRLGVTANALVVWRVPRNRVRKVGEFFSGFSEVTHCYERRTTQKWKYNVYTMIHGGKRRSVDDFVKGLAA